MRTVASSQAVVVLFLFLSFCPDMAATSTSGSPNQQSAVTRTTAQLTDHELSILNSCNTFGLKLFREIVAATPSTENVFISPLSVSYALALCYNGAKGDTRAAIGNTLELGDLSVDELNRAYYDLTQILVQADTLVEIQITNSLWSRIGGAIQPEFVSMAQEYFDARVEEVDFQAPGTVNMINDWVKRTTNGKIMKMVQPPIDYNTVVMLLNGIYFKGSWMFPFMKEKTRDAYFYMADGSVTQCRMMMENQSDCVIETADNPQSARNYAKISYYDDSEVLVLNMPYGAGDIGMCIVVPNRMPSSSADTSATIEDVIRGITPEKWALWTSGRNPSFFTLGLPRFKFDYDIDLEEILKKLGMEVAFNSDLADFGGLLAKNRGCLTEAKQKTFIQVDDVGTVAVAISLGTTINVSAKPPKPRVICDRPFLVVIYEDVSGAILFMGRIANPVWED